MRATWPSWGAFCALGIGSLVAAGGVAQASSIQCPKETPDAACGQCEPTLQQEIDGMMTNAFLGTYKSAADFLADVPLEMRQNMVVVADSKSRQKATVKGGKTPADAQISPRIIWKSPNAEVFISFNTDPSADGYDKIEIQRWNGKEGKFDYQEVEFPKERPPGAKGPAPAIDGNKAHVSFDASKDCVECHRQDPRPNFDSYQTWAGFVPPRDDVLEKGRDGKPDPNTQVWFSFMNQVVAAKKKAPPPNRLSSIVVPYPGNMSDEDKLKAIQDVVNQGPPIGTANSTNEDTSTLYGYRIPHVPNKRSGQLLNTSSKTFPDAGFGHTTFDQLLNLQMCHVATSLKKRPDFDKFRWGMAALAEGCANSSTIAQYMPSAAQDTANQYFASRGLAPQGGSAVSTTTITAAVRADTGNNEKLLDQQKQRRHTEFLKSVNSPDPAGNGKRLVSVPDASTDEIAGMRYLLEPLGVKVGDWSMSFGDDLAHPSYTFADQFEILHQQDMFEDIRRQYNNAVPKPNDYCEWLKSQSLAAFAGNLAANVAPREKSSSELVAQCQDKGKLAPAAGGAADVSQKLLRERGRRTLEGCLNCHDTSSMVNGNLTAGTNVFDVDHLKTWLSSKRTGGGDQTWFDRIVSATGHGGKVSMPPNNPLDPETRDTFLGYLSSVMASDDGKGTGFNCEALPSRDTKPVEAAPAAADQKGDSVATPAKVQK